MGLDRHWTVVVLAPLLGVGRLIRTPHVSGRRYWNDGLASDVQRRAASLHGFDLAYCCSPTFVSNLWVSPFVAARVRRHIPVRRGNRMLPGVVGGAAPHR